MDWRSKGLIIGAVAGALLGLLVAWVILEDVPAEGESPVGARPGRKKVRSRDVVKLATSAAMLVRQIAELRAGGK
ncbi:MAG: hypothetical protein H5T59_09835 [Anaerolineae bacterium]|nr:hypothetical protein [Anaerolineae bacterium]